jgi:hypothetical protein
MPTSLSGIVIDILLQILVGGAIVTGAMVYSDKPKIKDLEDASIPVYMPVLQAED